MEQHPKSIQKYCLIWYTGDTCFLDRNKLLGDVGSSTTSPVLWGTLICSENHCRKYIYASNNPFNICWGYIALQFVANTAREVDDIARICLITTTATCMQFKNLVPGTCPSVAASASSAMATAPRRCATYYLVSRLSMNSVWFYWIFSHKLIIFFLCDGAIATKSVCSNYKTIRAVKYATAPCFCTKSHTFILLILLIFRTSLRMR